MNIQDFGDLEHGYPTPSPEQYASQRDVARAYLSVHAPDLLDMVLGVE